MFKRSVNMILKVLVKSVFRGVIVSFITYYVLFTAGCAKDENIVNPSQSAITVIGKVTDYLGNGLGNIKVESKAGTTRTSSDGSFVFTNMTAPYDITFYPFMQQVVSFKNITTTKPILPFSNSNSIVASGAFVTVIIPQMNNNQKALARFYDSTGIYISEVTINTSFGRMGIEWYGSQNISGKMVLWIYTPSNSGGILTYDKYGEKPITVLNGETGRIVFNDFDLNTNPGDTIISGNIILPSGFQIESKSIGMQRFSFGNYYVYGHLNNIVNINGTNYSLFVPALNGDIYKYFAVIGIINTSNYKYGTKVSEIYLNNVNIIGFNTFPTILTPDDNEQNVDYKTQFSFTKDTPQGIYYVTIYYYANNNNAVMYLYMDNETFNLPILSDTTLNINNNTQCQWSVTKLTGFSSIDDFISIPPVKNPKYREILRTEDRTFNFKQNK